MTRIAVQIFGHLRTFERCAPALRRNLLRKFDCDVFIHTWTEFERTTRSWYCITESGRAKEVDEKARMRVEELYQPKQMIFEDQISLYPQDAYFGTHEQTKISLQGLANMMLAQQSVTKLRQDWEIKRNEKYDLVLMIRPDIELLEEFRPERFFSLFNFNPNTTVHLIHNLEVKLKQDSFILYPRMADVFFFGLTESMNIFSNIFSDFEKHFVEISTTLPPGVQIPEFGFVDFIQQNGVNPRFFSFSYAIRRSQKSQDVVPPHLQNRPRRSWKLTHNLKEKFKNE